MIIPRTHSLIILSLFFFFLADARSVAAQETDTSTTHNSEMERVLGTPKYDIRQIGILVYDGVNDLDVMGPKYVLGQIMGATTRLVAIESGNITTVMGTEIVPDATTDEVDSLDILVIPGGLGGTIKTAQNEHVRNWIRRIDSTTKYTAAVCTGGWVLAATGLLEGREATTNWYRADERLAEYGVTFTDERFTQDEKYWTSAGVTAGMDIALAMLVDLYGDKAYAQAIMLDMEYDPAPPIEGGTPTKTAPDVLQLMQAMYDMVTLPLLNQSDQQ